MTFQHTPLTFADHPLLIDTNILPVDKEIPLFEFAKALPEERCLGARWLSEGLRLDQIHLRYSEAGLARRVTIKVAHLAEPRFVMTRDGASNERSIASFRIDHVVVSPATGTDGTVRVCFAAQLDLRTGLLVIKHASASLLSGTIAGTLEVEGITLGQAYLCCDKTAPETTITLRQANDVGQPSQLVADNLIRLSREAPTQVNVFDLAIDASTIGYTRVDYTDLIAEGGSITAIVIKLKGHAPEGGLVDRAVELALSPQLLASGHLDFRPNPVSGDSADCSAGATLTVPLDHPAVGSTNVMISFWARLNRKTGALTVSALAEPCSDLVPLTIRAIAIKPELSFAGPTPADKAALEAALDEVLSSKTWAPEPLPALGRIQPILDRNRTADGRGRYSLIDNRKNTVIHNGDPVEDFFVLKLKDAYAAVALAAYAQAAEADGRPDYAKEIRALEAKAGHNHPHVQRPNAERLG